MRISLLFLLIIVATVASYGESNDAINPVTFEVVDGVPPDVTIDADSVYLSPINQDGICDTIHITHEIKEDNVLIYSNIVNKNKEVVWEKHIKTNSGEIEIEWNGCDSAGIPVLDGTYTYNAYASDKQGNIKAIKIEGIIVDNTPPELLLEPPNTGTFSPNNDGILDTIRFGVYVSDYKSVEIKITNEEEVYVKIHEGNAPDSFIWSGLNGEFPFPDGEYTLTITAIDHAGNKSIIEYDEINIDTTPPEINVRIGFAVDKSYLRKMDAENLEAAYDAINTYTPFYHVDIEGHCDLTGAEERNVLLSMNRALSVMDYLIERGIPGECLHPFGFSYEQPRCTNDTLEGRQCNRRVEFKLYRVQE